MTVPERRNKKKGLGRKVRDDAIANKDKGVISFLR